LPFDAKDAVKSAVTGLLEGKTGWKRTKGPCLAREMTAMVRRSSTYGVFTALFCEAR